MGLPADYAAAGAPPATPRAYALLFAPDAVREALASLYALDAEIAAATGARVEHSVAHTKLAWWRTEVDRLRGGRPEHPVTRALHAAAPRGVDFALLHERLAAADLRLAGYAPATPAELDALLYRSHGALAQLAAQCAAGGPVDETVAGCAARLGRGIGLVEALRDRRLDAGSGVPRVPLDAVEAAGQGPDALAAATPPDALVAVLAGQAERAREALAAAASGLPPAARRTQRHGLVLAALHAAVLDGLVGARFAPTAPPHPLRLLWIAWRIARRA